MRGFTNAIISFFSQKSVHSLRLILIFDIFWKYDHYPVDGVLLAGADGVPPVVGFGVRPVGPFFNNSWLKKSANIRSLAWGAAPLAAAAAAADGDAALILVVADVGTDGLGNWADGFTPAACLAGVTPDLTTDGDATPPLLLMNNYHES